MREAATRGPDGARPTRIAEGREAEIFAWGEHDVLRVFRDANAHDRADREMRALDAVRAALPGVPAVRERMEWNGRPALRLERLDGRGVLAELQQRPWRAWTLARLCGRVHARLNQIRAPDALPALQGELRRRLEDQAIPGALRAAALAELDRLPDGDALCHGDFQPDNVLLCSGGPVVIDWPNAARGDACADFARTALMMRFGALPPGAPSLIRWGHRIGRGIFARTYTAGYEETLRHDAAALRRWKLVRAVERLADRIEEERAPLLRAAECLRRAPA